MLADFLLNWLIFFLCMIGGAAVGAPIGKWIAIKQSELERRRRGHRR